MSEGFKMTAKRRDDIWKEIQIALEMKKRRDISNALFCAEIYADGKPIMNPTHVTININGILDEYEKNLEQWDRFLHSGKTETEERKEFAEKLFGGKK